jgi:hypothetical protein
MMYDGIEAFDSIGLFYLPMWMIRFILFILIGSILCLYPAQETQALMFLNISYIIWYCSFIPHRNVGRYSHELFHEVFSMIAAYHLILYSSAYSYEV